MQITHAKQFLYYMNCQTPSPFLLAQPSLDDILFILTQILGPCTLSCTACFECCAKSYQSIVSTIHKLISLFEFQNLVPWCHRACVHRWNSLLSKMATPLIVLWGHAISQMKKSSNTDADEIATKLKHCSNTILQQYNLCSRWVQFRPKACSSRSWFQDWFQTGQGQNLVAWAMPSNMKISTGGTPFHHVNNTGTIWHGDFRGPFLSEVHKSRWFHKHGSL